jgi:hypothetical protein
MKDAIKAFAKGTLEFARALGVTAVSTLLLIWGTELFVTPSIFTVGWIDSAKLAVELTLAAWAFYIVIAVVTVWLSNIKEAGILMFTVMGTISGGLAIYVLSMYAPSMVSVDGFVSTLPYAFINTLGVWGVAWAFGTAGTNLKWLPETNG